MNYKIVEDITAPELKIYQQLRESAFKDDESFIADSPKVVNIILESDIEVKSILATKEYYSEFCELVESKEIENFYVVTKEEMQKIVGHKIHHNCMLHGVRPSQTALDNLDDEIIMLDAITSTENVGSIARSAAALGVNSYLLPQDAPHPYSRRSVRVSMGHISKLKYHAYRDIFETIKALKELGYKIFAAEVDENATELQKVEVPKKWVLLMGQEGKGLSREIIEACDECVEIEMDSDVRSFNVGVAASIMMYSFKSYSLV